MMHVTIVVPNGHANLSSIVGPYQILSRANLYWQKVGNKPVMEVCIAGFAPELTLDGGFFAVRPLDIRAIAETDLVIVPSVDYEYVDVIKNNTVLLNWIRQQHEAGVEVASICTGAFLLAATGLLDGKSCSTHWNTAADFINMFPKVKLEVDKLITAEHGIYTNGGAYSFLNMVLYLVEKYFDRNTAIYCSKVFQIDIERTSQSPFFIFKTRKNHGDEMVCRAQSYIEENLRERISFEELASKLAISRRSFDRRFIKATGNTPVEYLQRAKVEVAKMNLERGRKSIVDVMTEVGYSDDKAFREVFKRITGLSPLDYKAKYSKQLLSYN